MCKLVLCLIFICPLIVSAQEASLLEMAEEEAEDQILVDAAIQSAVQSNKEGFSVIATKGSSATFTFGYRDFNLILEGPLGDADLTKLVSLDGLANSVTVDFGYKHVLWNRTFKKNAIKSLGRELLTNTFSDFGDREKEDYFINTKKAKENRNYKNSVRRLVNQAAQEYKSSFLMGGRLKFGWEDFEYLVQGGSKTDDTVANWAPEIFAGFFNTKTRVYVGASYSYEVSHKAGDKVTVCKDFPGVPNGQQCEDTPFGPPSEEKSHLAQTELRWYFSDSFAINPRLTYSSNEKVYSFEFPVYFAKNKKLEKKAKEPASDDEKPVLTGGVSIGWRSDNDKPVLSMFVGAIGLFDWLED
jgi:hypothetical protein